ncbi:hypothetical protein BCR33DRAFT_324390 [Rhizoclosmatium globosum]|uniref:SWIM-type domain-containing protein n=1 Tax=Rhizoclosmatium globosum TaxID=329046 RepID=A0A1Y2D007_9FUNG|nr:hypothetical protein BCR33DRAFT_324390 [Rhizoclosmatium globosum]|eukprot:ORY52608.1 hypothetical protein BCR33DRAFT_324390 [Rhizoclosmatium globosum]
MNPNNTNTVLTRPKYPPNRPNHRFSGEERKLLQTAMLNGCDATLKSKDQRTELAIKLNVDEERIRQWFSNNRSKSKELLSIPPSISTPPPITSAVLSPFVPNFGITSVPPAPPSLPKEVRLEPYRPNPTHLMVERIAKAQLQRCRLVAKRIISPLHVEYKVNSSVKGTVHVCSVKEKPHCECVDFESGRNCKHLIFIFMRVLGLGPNSPILYQRALLKSELLNMFAQGAACDPTYVVSSFVSK